jgi:DNA-binding NtrC family response regulator
MTATTSVTTQPELHGQCASQELIDICIVDDEPSIMEMLRGTLTDSGYRCFGTTDPQEALNHISSGKCRIILCDSTTPGMDGLTFLEQALQRDPGVYVILMTGYYSIE